jgi:hypothetical protein
VFKKKKPEVGRPWIFLSLGIFSLLPLIQAHRDKKLNLYSSCENKNKNKKINTLKNDPQ